MNLRPVLKPAKTKLFALIACTVVLAACPGLPSLAADRLAAYEQQLFYQSYESETKEQRIQRLEERVYGQAQPGNLADREVKLLNSMAAVQRAVPATRSAKQTDFQAAPSGEPDYQQPAYQPPQTPIQPPARPDATNYPTVIALEKKVLGQSFINDSINSRLSRLETKVFGKTFGDLALVDRVDKLLAKFPDTSVTPDVAATEGYDSYDNEPREWTPNPAESTSMSPSGRDVFIKVDEMEIKIFGKSFPSRLITERLDTLEDQVLGGNYKGQSIDNRVARLLDRFKVATNPVRTRPGIQTRPGFVNPDGSYSSSYQESYQPSSSAPPRNIQIGAGMSSTTSGVRFSNELMSMLPPDMRAAVGSNGSSYTTTSPGTVVMPQPGGYPGYQTFNGSGSMQYKSYVNGPGYSESTTHSTTVVQPNGTQTVYSYEQPFPGGGYVQGYAPQGYAPQAYTGNPAVFQSLNELEVRMFGKITQAPVPVRLARLEATLMGQSYAGYPDNQRVANLQKAYQYQSLNRALGGNTNPQAGGPRLGLPLTPQSQQPSSTPFR